MILLWISWSLGSALMVIHRDQTDAVDFATFYGSARALVTGDDPYRPDLPNLNAPLVIAATAPLTRLSQSAALWTWVGLNLAGFVVSLWLVARAGFPWEPVAIGFGSLLTGALAVEVGQLTFLLTPLAIGAWLLDRRGSAKGSGVLMGLLVIAKPLFALFLAWWIWRRAWRQVCAAVAIIGLGWRLMTAWDAGLLLAWTERLQSVDWQANIFNASWPGVAARVFSTRFAAEFSPLLVSEPLERIVRLAGTLTILAVSVPRWRSASVDQGWALVGLTAFLMAPLGWTYALPLVLAPVMLVLPVSQWLVPVVVLNLPAGIVYGRPPYGPIGTLLGGSFAFWAVGVLWWHVWRARDRTHDPDGGRN